MKLNWNFQKGEGSNQKTLNTTPPPLCFVHWGGGYEYLLEPILEGLYVTPKIFGVELGFYANFWRISQGFFSCCKRWRGVNPKHSKHSTLTWTNGT